MTRSSFLTSNHFLIFGLLWDEKILLPSIDPPLCPGLDHHLLKAKNICNVPQRKYLKTGFMSIGQRWHLSPSWGGEPRTFRFNNAIFYEWAKEKSNAELDHTLS